MRWANWNWNENKCPLEENTLSRYHIDFWQNLKDFWANIHCILRFGKHNPTAQHSFFQFQHIYFPLFCTFSSYIAYVIAEAKKWTDSLFRQKIEVCLSRKQNCATIGRKSLKLKRLVTFKTFDQSVRRHDLTNQKTKTKAKLVLQPLPDLTSHWPESTSTLCFPSLHCCWRNLELGLSPPMRSQQPRLFDQSRASNEIEQDCCSLLYSKELLQKSHDWPPIRKRISVLQCIESQAQGYLNTYFDFVNFELYFITANLNI